MKKLILAACVAAVGMPVWGQQAPQVQPPQAQPPRPNVDYGLYGGPSSAPAPSQSQSRPRVRYHQGTMGPYEMYGVPDDLTMAEQEQMRIRDAAVEFGRFRRQFTGSTQFWMDQHRTELAVSKYAMDENLWHGIHPSFEFGDGAYLYNTAVNVGDSAVWRQSQTAQTAAAAPVAPPVVNAVPAETTPPTAPVAVPSRSTAPPRVIAGSKPVYDAAAAVQPSR